MPDPTTLMVIFAAFLLAGTVKGMLGFGLPLISLGVLTSFMGLPAAMALSIAPAAATNLWQALAGGHLTPVLRRIWPFLLMASLTVWIGARALTGIDHHYLIALLGLLLIIYAVLSLSGFRPAFSPRMALWLGPPIGVVNGILTGMTGVFVVPGAMYLQACGLERDELIQAMGLFFLISTIALALALGGHGLLDLRLGALSAAALVPAFLGMAAGQRLRARMSETMFRKAFLTGLLVLGTYLVIKSALSAG